MSTSNMPASEIHRPLRVGLVGFGFAGQTFHAPVIASVPGLLLAAVSTSRPDRLRAAWPGVDAVPDAASLFARPDIDLVVIAAPNAEHHPLALAALQAGKHVVVDKPFVLDARQAREVADAAQRLGRLVSVYQNRRFDADFLSLQQVLARGDLGRIVYVESHFDRFRAGVRDRWREQAVPGAGLWLDLGAHLMDQALQLFGPPDSIQLDLAALRDGAVVEDYFHAVLRYGAREASAMRMVLHATTLAASASPRFIVHGTRGSWIKQGVDPQEDALRAGRRPNDEGWGEDREAAELVEVDEQGSKQSRSLPMLRGDYAAYYAAIRDAIRDGQPNPVTPAQAIELMQWLDAGRVSAAEHRAVTA